MKDISQLIILDFVTNPVWTWDDDDGNVVIPLIGEIKPDEHNAIFVSSRFLLSDGSAIQGFVAIRMSDQKVYLIALADKHGNLFDIPLEISLRDLIDLDQLNKSFGKGLSDIFPLKYSTVSLSYLGDKLEGKIEWFRI